jgi:hypothetical protein
MEGWSYFASHQHRSTIGQSVERVILLLETDKPPKLVGAAENLKPVASP